MGDGAADQFARETGMSFGDAYDCLYGESQGKPRCPLCGKKYRNDASILNHLEGGRHKPTDKLATLIVEWRNRVNAKEAKP